jgi:phosphonopyruvate decarboxylase
VIAADDFLGPARRAGFDFFTGVPCSFLTQIINRVIGDKDLTYVGAASEGEAVAIAAGAWLAGRDTVVMFQNSGLGNAVNPLTSLNYPFRIPTLVIATWRGAPNIKDEPQHELMGQITGALFELMRVPHRPFPKTAAAVPPALDEARAVMAQTGLPFAFVMEKGDVADATLDGRSPAPRPPGRRIDACSGDIRRTRYEMLEALLEELPATAAVIATTGKCGRELFTLADRPQHLYQVGSMGCAAGMGLGVALNVRRPVVVLDGDGALLMKMGTIATIGACGPENLVHVVLDNGVHDSTGGQPTVSPSVDFAEVALACGYARAYACDGDEGFRTAVRESLTNPGPHLIHMRIQPGSLDKLGRPTVKPYEVAARFKAFLADGRAH